MTFVTYQMVEKCGSRLAKYPVGYRSQLMIMVLVFLVRIFHTFLTASGEKTNPAPGLPVEQGWALPLQSNLSRHKVEALRRTTCQKAGCKWWLNSRNKTTSSETAFDKKRAGHFYPALLIVMAVTD